MDGRRLESEENAARRRLESIAQRKLVGVAGDFCQRPRRFPPTQCELSKRAAFFELSKSTELASVVAVWLERRCVTNGSDMN